MVAETGRWCFCIYGIIFNEDILKSFIELTIKGIVDNKKTTNTQKKKRSRA